MANNQTNKNQAENNSQSGNFTSPTYLNMSLQKESFKLS